MSINDNGDIVNLQNEGGINDQDIYDMEILYLIQQEYKKRIKADFERKVVV